MEILEQSLGRVKAPAELWTRVDQVTVIARRPGLRRNARWALAAAGALAAIILVFYQPTLRSGDPAAIRYWVKSRTGMDVPLAKKPGITLMGARIVETSAVEVAYQVGEKRGTLLVSKARRNSRPHWGAYAVSCETAACVLCHS